jgi:hypothetical protein
MSHLRKSCRSDTMIIRMTNAHHCVYKRYIWTRTWEYTKLHSADQNKSESQS